MLYGGNAAERGPRHGRIAMGVTYDGNAGDRGHSARVRRTGAIDPLPPLGASDPLCVDFRNQSEGI